MSGTVRTDGSATADRPDVVRIDLEDASDRWRYTCTNGHRNWTPTNGGVWCSTCSRHHEIEDPHHHALVDLVTDRTIPWSAIELGGDADD